MIWAAITIIRAVLGDNDLPTGKERFYFKLVATVDLSVYLGGPAVLIMTAEPLSLDGQRTRP